MLSDLILNSLVLIMYIWPQEKDNCSGISPYLHQQKFRAFVLESDKAMDITAYLLCYGLEIKDKPGTLPLDLTDLHFLIDSLEQHGMCRVLSYMIQGLSAERSFGMKLSSPLKAHLPQKWAIVGNAGDFIVQVRCLDTARLLLYIDLSATDHLFYGRNNVGKSQLTISRARHCSVQLCSILQELERDLFCTPLAALQRIR